MLKTELENLKKTLADSKKSNNNSSLNSLNHNLNQKIKIYSDEITQLKETNANTKNSYSQLKASLEQYENSKKTDSQEIDSRKQDIKELQEKNYELLKNLENTVSKDHLDNEKQQYETSNLFASEKLNTEIKNLEQQNNELREEL